MTEFLLLFLLNTAILISMIGSLMWAKNMMEKTGNDAYVWVTGCVIGGFIITVIIVSP